MREPVHKMALFALSFLLYLTITIISVIMIIRANLGGDAQEYTFLGMTFLYQEITIGRRMEWHHSFSFGGAVFYFPLLLAFITLIINEVLVRFVRTDKHKRMVKRIALILTVAIVGFSLFLSFENVESEDGFRINFYKVPEVLTGGFDDTYNRNLEDYLFPVDNFHVKSGEEVRDEFQMMAYSIANIINSDAYARPQGTAFLIEKTDYSLYFLTNAHVVEDGESIDLYFGLNREHYRGQVIAKENDPDTNLDVAVLEVSKDEFLNPEWLHVFEFYSGKWHDIDDNEQFITFGFPDSEPFFNTAIYQKNISFEEEIIYEPNLRPGSSGSPMLNQNLEVIGLNWGHRNHEQGRANTANQVLEFLETVDLD